MSQRLANKMGSTDRPGRVRSPAVAGMRPNRFHTFLKRLRASGRSNMYGAIPYLMQAFGLDREAAFRIVCEWVDREETERPDLSAGASPRR